MKTRTKDRRIVTTAIRINRYQARSFIFVPVGIEMDVQPHSTQPHLVVCKYTRNGNDITITISKDKLRLSTRPAVGEVRNA